MFTPTDIKKLNAVKSPDSLVSLYFNTDQGLQTKEKILTSAKDLLKEVADTLPTNLQQKVLDYLDKELKQEIKGLAFFIDPAGEPWQQYEFRVPVRQGIYQEKNLHLTQLEELLDEYERYCTVVLDKEKAQIFTVFLGEIEDVTDVFNEFPGKHAQGGWSQKRFQGHIKDHEQRHLKEVAIKAYDFFQQDGFDRLIIAGSQEILPVFKETLHADLQSRLAGEFATELFQSTEHFLQESLKVAERIEREKEAELVKELGDNLGAGNKAVSGIRDTLQAVNDKKIMKLVLADGFTQSGYNCPSCGLLGLEADECGCQGESNKVADLIDEMVQAAIAQGAKIEFVKDSKELEDLGSVGAFLRY
ncbi:MAG: host attachment protein [Parcubacteria group bacterium]|nr:host attachment protein [Parcubacteria group bacterium]